VNPRAGQKFVHINWWARAALAVMSLTMGATAWSQTSRPVSVSKFDNQTILKSSGNDATTQHIATLGKPHDLLDTGRVFFALVIVLGLIFLLRWIGKRFFPSIAGGTSSGIVRVLSRSPVTSKQHVLLVQVGKRVLVVADNGTQMTRLSEITDPDEVAVLVGQTGNRMSETKNLFGAEFGKARESFEEKSEPEMSDDESPRATEDQDESISSTRGEIDGLMEKVRVLAKQLGR
jgi:flagellar biogenesis protein FliO